MSATPQFSTISVYLDSTYLIDLANPSEPRHADAQALLQLFQSYQGTGEVSVITSTWTATEAHGVLYGKELTQNGFQPQYRHGRRLKIRDYLPPSQPHLAQEDQPIVNTLSTLQSTTDFELWPRITDDTNSIWQLARRLGLDAAIWPPDALHLAIAIESACSLIVSDDLNFLDKVDWCLQTVIEPHRQVRLAQIHSTIPQFAACALTQSTVLPRSQPPRTRPSAMGMLAYWGFT